MTDTQQRAAAKESATFWKGKGYEKGENQFFWQSLLRDVFGVEHPEQYISSEQKVTDWEIDTTENAPPHHDPFDRMLIAQAKAENMSFLTHDASLPYYEEKCIISV